MRALALALLGWLAFPPTAAATGEEGRPVLRTWNEGAAGTQTWQVRQLPNGLVAFAWRQGLLFFDGERFEAVEVPGGTVHDFAVGPGQRIHVATSQQLGYLEPDARRNWRFVALPLPAHAPAPGDIGRVLHHDGRSFYLSRSLLLIHEDAAGWRWRSGKGLYAELRLREDGLWLYEDGSGWLRWDPGSGEFVPATQTGLPQSGLGITSEQAGEPWYASDRKALYRRIDGAWERFAVDADPRWLDDRIESLARLPSGELAVGTRFGGLYQFSASGHLVRRVAPSLLPGERITDIEIDAEGALWLALDGGIARLEPDNRVTRFGRADGAVQIEGIERIGGLLYLATRLGLKRLEPAGNDGLPARLVDTAVRRNSAWDLLATPQGLLVGTGSGLVLLAHARAAPLELLSGRRVSAMAAAPDGWIYLVNANQLRRLRWQGSRFELDPQALTLVPMFAAHWHEGALWCSIDGGGAFRIDALERWPQARATRFDERQGLKPSRTSFAVDPAGLLLLNEGRPWRPQGAGLVRASEFPAGFGFEQIQADGKGQWWSAGVGAPVLRLEREQSGYRIRAAILQRFAHPARHLLVEADGTLWLGDDEGLLRMRAPPEDAPLRAQPLLREVRSADGQRLYGGAGTANHAPRLELAANQREVSMRFALPTFQHERPTRWRWRLNADDWSSLEDATLRIGLPAGASTLELAASDGLGRSALLAVRAQVAPFWYETHFARFAALVLFAALLMASALWYARWRTRRLEAERARLELLVAERSAELRRQAEEIRAWSEARTRFFGNLGHEFRTPLTLVLGPLGDALDGRFGTLGAGLSAALESARSSAGRLLRLVGDLLDLSRLAAGRFELRIAEHDLAEQLRRGLEAFAQQAHARGIELGGEGLADPLLLWYDADQLERMLGKLLANALKFTPAGGHVLLRLLPTAQEVGIAVEDDGPGIAAEEQVRIFERFYQGAAAAAPDAPGTGIGLALVRELIELHHGRAELASTVGRGSCFTLWLRRGHAHFDPTQMAQPRWSAASEPGPGTATSTEQAGGTPASGPRPSLLLVDDHAELRRYLADRLGDAYQLRIARDGEEALAMIAEDLPDVVVSEVMIVGVDGIALARTLRRDPETAGVPLLLLSAGAHKRDLVAGLEAGADDYLTKPFDTSELIARIEALLEARRRLRAQLLAEQAAPAAPAEPTDAGDARQPTPIESASQRFAERLQQVLARHSGEPAFGVAELAQALHMDRASLFRRVRGSHQITPGELLREYRLQRAQVLLRAHRGNVSEIAYAVGYDNLSHFSQAFRKRYGVAPSSLL